MAMKVASVTSASGDSVDVCLGNVDTKYDRGDVVGRGGFGSVYRAVSRETKVVVAIKVLTLDQSREAIALDEIALLRMCDNAYITKLYDVYWNNAERQLSIVMELCDLGALRGLVRSTGVLPESCLQVVAFQVLSGLAYMHARNLIHRDVKAENVLLCSDGLCKLADLGVGGKAHEDAQNHTFVGTTAYLSPELALGTGYQKNVDVWATGITMIELAEGRPPLEDVPPARAMFCLVGLSNGTEPPPTFQTPSNFSSDFNDFIRQCLTRDPNERPSSQTMVEQAFAAAGKDGGPARLVALCRQRELIDASGSPTVKASAVGPEGTFATAAKPGNANSPAAAAASSPTPAAPPVRPSATNDEPTIRKAVTAADGRIVLFCDDKLTGENARAIQQITKEFNNVHFLAMMGSTELKAWLAQHAEQLKPLIKANKLRVITNRYRRDDGGEQAGELLLRWILDNKTWKKVPCMLYCGNPAPVLHLHNPKKRHFVSNSAFAMRKFVLTAEVK